MVIGGQAYRLLPMTTAGWEEKRILVDEKTGRVWPNAELSEGVELTRDYVVRQFWQSFLEDKFELGNAIQTKAERQDRRLGRRKLGRIQIRSKHVDIYLRKQFFAVDKPTCC